MTTAQRRERHRIIQEALLAGLIHSQQDVVRILKRANIKVTQATASRDLEEIGAVRGKSADGETTYLLSDAPRIATEDLALSVDEAERMIVLRTRPGAAQLIAGRIDRAEVSGVVGTIAGDDTIFVACAKGQPVKKVKEEIDAIILGEEVKGRNSRTSKARR